MPRKPTRRSSTLPKPKPLRPRVEAALREGRFPQALELARQLHAQEPTPASADVLRDVLRAGLRHHAEREAYDDLRRWLDEAERLDGPADWWEALALARARAGDADRARQLLDKAPGSAALPRVVGHLADRALRDRKHGKALLPPELHPGYDAVATAFGQYERGEDEAARQSLQAVGLQSPFLDWKLLLRGLIAHAANEDVRALENWQRLDPDRLPAKLAAPFRFLIDPAYRNGLAAEPAAAVARRADQVGHPLLAPLRDLQRTLASPEGLPRALKQAPALLGMLRMNFPHLVPKLANCFYWLIVQGGQPEDLKHYQRLFGSPPDDRDFHRLQAFVMESYPQLETAHECWKSYLEEIEQAPDRWPGEHGRRARAAVLQRMGDNAREHLEAPEEPSFDDFFDIFDDPRRSRAKPKPLVPSAETCYREAMKLVPEWKEPLARLMQLLVETERWAEAEAAGKKALERFPDEVGLLLDVATAQQAMGKVGEARDNLKHALTNNPLDRALRSAVALADVQHGRERTLAKDYDGARAAFREAIELEPELAATVARAAWAAAEYKAGDADAAARIVAQIDTAPPRGPAATYYLVVEFGRAKVAKPVLKEHEDRLKEFLAGRPPVAELLSLAVALSFYRHERPPYRGLGTHEKKVVALLQAAVDAKPAEDDLVRIGWLALGQRYPKVLKTCGEQGEKRFPDNPCFPFFTAEHQIRQRPKTFAQYTVGQRFREVLRLTEGKQDDRSRMMRETIEQRRQEYPGLEIWLNPGKLAPFFGPDGGWDD